MTWNLSRSATLKATSPIIASTDRSTLRVMTTSASPTAAMAMIDDSTSTAVRFDADRNWGAWMATSTPITTITTDQAELALAGRARQDAGGPRLVVATASATAMSSPRPAGRVRRVDRARRGRRTRACCPVAAYITLSSVARSRRISAVRRPSWSTTMRSDIARTSGRSLEMRMMPRPEAASSEMMRCTSTLAPMSMPRVGSSRMSTLGSVASHLASTPSAGCHPRGR